VFGVVWGRGRERGKWGEGEEEVLVGRISDTIGPHNNLGYDDDRGQIQHQWQMGNRDSTLQIRLRRGLGQGREQVEAWYRHV
jgi:hypothetical protein